MKQSKGWVVAFLLAVVVSAVGSLVYSTGVFNKPKSGIDSVAVSRATNIYENTYKNMAIVLRFSPPAYSSCIPVKRSIKIDFNKDSIYFYRQDGPTLGYRVLGIDPRGVLHAIRPDSAQIVLERVHAPGDTTGGLSHQILLVRQPETTFLLFPQDSCPGIEK